MQNSERPIVIFDSGMGGLNYLKSLQRRFNEKFIYVADTKNFPYGIKSAGELNALLLTLSKTIQRRFNPKSLVIACNTATLNALPQIKDLLKIPVIGTRPPFKEAVALSRNKRIGLLATKSTVTNPAVIKQVEKLKDDAVFTLLAASDLVRFIEKKFLGSTQEERLSELFPLASYMIMEKIDTLILGCTHFLSIKEDLQSLLPFVRLIDTVDTVAAALTRQCAPALRAKNDEMVKSELYLTDSNEETTYTKFSRYTPIIYRGVLSL
jgi:glutamate racemase